jgi:hypothetical protein
MFLEDWMLSGLSKIRNRIEILRHRRLNTERDNDQVLHQFRIGSSVLLLENEGVVVNHTYGSSRLLRFFKIHKQATVTFLIMNGDNVLRLTLTAHEVCVLKDAKRLLVVASLPRSIY